MLDTEPEGGNTANTVSILYQEEQAGFLAGYAVVKDGYTKLGYIGAWTCRRSSASAMASSGR